MAEVRLNDGQQLLAFNDFYLGQRTHLSSRYSVTWREQTERQSSSGVLVVDRGRLDGLVQLDAEHGGGGHAPAAQGRRRRSCRGCGWRGTTRGWSFVVREPFRSKASDVNLTAGLLEPGEELRLESHMPEGGVIFSDGVEADALAFNSGAVAVVRAADRQTKLVAA